MKIKLELSGMKDEIKWNIRQANLNMSIAILKSLVFTLSE